MVFIEPRSLTLVTPNILASSQSAVVNGLSKKVKEEVLDSIRYLLTQTGDRINHRLPNIKLGLDKTLKESRLNENELEVTVKLFFLENDMAANRAYIQQALDEVYQKLDINKIDTLFIAFNGQSLQNDSDMAFSNQTLPIDSVAPVWQELGAQLANKKISNLGVSEFSKPLLEKLIEKTKIIPSANQVNLGEFNNLPKNLSSYCKSNDIKLYNHIDPIELISVNDLNQVLEGTSLQSNNYIPRWAARYTVMFKSRGVIASRGYIVNTTTA